MPTVPTALAVEPSAQPRPQPAVYGLEVAKVFGFAYQHTAFEGIQPLSNFPLHLEATTVGRAPVSIDVLTDASGRYEVPEILREYAMVGAPVQDGYLSPCSARLWLWNDRPLNVHVVSKATFLATGMPPSMPPLSKLGDQGYEFSDKVFGVVTERTANGVQPVAGASVQHFYGTGQSGRATGFTLTNADGSYALCGYSDDYGQAVRVSKDGYRTSIQSIGPSWRMDFEIARQ